MKRGTLTIASLLLAGSLLFAGTAAADDNEGLIDIEYDEDDNEGLIDINYDEDDDEGLISYDDEEDFDWANSDTLAIGNDEYVFDHRIETYLFIGTDDSGNEYDVDSVEASAEEKGEYRGRMADFLTLLVIDHTDDSYGFLQLDRNTMAEVMMYGSDGEYIGTQDMQLCIAHYFGRSPEQSCENTVESVRLAIGDIESISGYYALHMDDVGVLADLVGGVEVTLEDDLTKIDPTFTKGATVTLSGDKAEAYVRARMGVGDGSNAGRMRRQRAYMQNFYDKAMARVKTDYNFVDELYGIMKDVAVTDISGNEVGRIAETLRKGKNKGILQFAGETKIEVSAGDDLEHEAFYPDEESMAEVLGTLFSLKKLDEDGEIDPDWNPESTAEQ